MDYTLTAVQSITEHDKRPYETPRPKPGQRNAFTYPSIFSLITLRFEILHVYYCIAYQGKRARATA